MMINLILMVLYYFNICIAVRISSSNWISGNVQYNVQISNQSLDIIKTAITNNHDSIYLFGGSTGSILTGYIDYQYVIKYNVSADTLTYNPWNISSFHVYPNQYASHIVDSSNIYLSTVAYSPFHQQYPHLYINKFYAQIGSTMTSISTATNLDHLWSAFQPSYGPHRRWCSYIYNDTLYLTGGVFPTSNYAVNLLLLLYPCTLSVCFSYFIY